MYPWLTHTFNPITWEVDLCEFKDNQMECTVPWMAQLASTKYP